MCIIDEAQTSHNVSRKASGESVENQTKDGLQYLNKENMEFTSKWMIFFTLNSVFVISCVFLQIWIQISMRFQAMLGHDVNTSSGQRNGTISCVHWKDFNYFQTFPKVCSSS